MCLCSINDASAVLYSTVQNVRTVYEFSVLQNLNARCVALNCTVYSACNVLYTVLYCVETGGARHARPREFVCDADELLPLRALPRARASRGGALARRPAAEPAADQLAGGGGRGDRALGPRVAARRRGRRPPDALRRGLSGAAREHLIYLYSVHYIRLLQRGQESTRRRTRVATRDDRLISFTKFRSSFS